MLPLRHHQLVSCYSRHQLQIQTHSSECRLQLQIQTYSSELAQPQSSTRFQKQNKQAPTEQDQSSPSANIHQTIRRRCPVTSGINFKSSTNVEPAANELTSSTQLQIQHKGHRVIPNNHHKETSVELIPNGKLWYY